MKNWLTVLLLLSLAACKDDVIDYSGNTPLKAADFMAAFPVLNTPITIADTNLMKHADTLVIGYKALAQFIPDTALTTLLGKETSGVLHPVGKIEKEKETYLLLNTTQKRTTRLLVFVTDGKKKYLGGRELLNNAGKDAYQRAVMINREPTFILSREKYLPGNTLVYTKEGWVYNDAGMFMIVIKDSNEEPNKMGVINPLDTLPRKNKFSGDYTKDKKNFISLRDGKDANTYQFFIHFEKNDGSCTGELKGELQMKAPNSAQYKDNGDPCIIDFTFNGNLLAVKEQGSCGNHRGIKCFFDDSYRRKKEPTPKKSRSSVRR